MSVNKELIKKIEAFLIATKVSKKTETLEYTSIRLEAPKRDLEDLEIDSAKQKIDEFIKKHRNKSFRDLLFKYIDDQNKKDAEVYKKALLDRRLFSKIRSDVDYHPNKRTVIALALALKLDLNQTLTLLKTAGYALSESSSFDLIIVYCVNHKIFAIDEVNEILDEFKLKPIGELD